MELKCSVQDIITVVQNVQNVGGLDRSFFVERVASLERARPCDLALIFDVDEGGVFDDAARKKLAACKAGVVLTSRSDVVDDRCIIVDNVLAAYERLIAHVRKESAGNIHHSAVIEPTARIGENVTIDAQAYVGHRVSIGSGTHVHAGAKVLDDCIIGQNTVVQAGAVIGSDGYRFVFSAGMLRKVPHVGIVRIGNYVEIGANCCIDRASFDETVIEDGVKLDNLVHIAHNVHVGAHTAIIAQTGIAGGARIGMGCQIGGQVGIKDHITIGNQVKIVSKSIIIKDVPDHAVVSGIPAMPITQWRKMVVLLGQLPELASELAQLRKMVAQAQQVSGSWFAKLRFLFSFSKK